MPTMFKELLIGDTFDFVDPDNRTLNSFFKRCEKTSERGYRDLGDIAKYQVGTIRCKVFNVERAIA